MSIGLFRIRPRDQGSDYVDMLQNGKYEGRMNDGTMQIALVGNAVPRGFVCSGRLVVGADTREAMVAAGLLVLEWRLIRVAKCINVSWREWKPGKIEYPSNIADGDEETGDDPEEYFAAMKHDARLAEALPALYEAIPAMCGGGTLATNSDFYSTSSVYWTGTALLFCSARSAAFIRSNCGDAVEVSEATAMPKCLRRT